MCAYPAAALGEFADWAPVGRLSSAGVISACRFLVATVDFRMEACAVLRRLAVRRVAQVRLAALPRSACNVGACLRGGLGTIGVQTRLGCWGRSLLFLVPGHVEPDQQDQRGECCADQAGSTPGQARQHTRLQLPSPGLSLGQPWLLALCCTGPAQL